MSTVTPTDRFHRLVSRAAFAAMVLGKGSEFELFFFSDGDEAAFKGARLRGLTNRGVIALMEGGKVDMELADDSTPEGRSETLRIMLAARKDFLVAVTLRG